MLSFLTASNLGLHVLQDASESWIRLTHLFSVAVKKVQAQRPELTDDQCIYKIAKGDQQALQVLFQRYGRLVFGYANKLLLSSSEAEDVSQEVWVKVIQAAKNYQSQDKCRSWLLQITRNTCFSFMRHQRRLQFVGEDTHKLDVDDPQQESILVLLENKENEDFIKKAIRDLPDAQRVALLMWVTESASYEVIAKNMDLTASSVKSLLFRAKQSLLKYAGGADE